MVKRILLALILLEGVCSAKPLPFVHDNYARALADARQRNVPLFVECWAPW